MSHVLLLLFNSESSLLIDTVNAYRVTLEQTSDGNITSTSLNGAISLFNPKGGDLTLLVLHKDRLDGVTNRSKMTVLISKDMIINYLEEQEIEVETLLITRQKMLDVLQVPLGERVELIKNELSLMSFMKIENIKMDVTQAESTCTLKYNLYDDWLSRISSYTAFSRLFLLLRGFHLNYDETFALLRDKETLVGNLWPSMTDDEWIEVERGCKNIVLESWCTGNDTTEETLTNEEIRNIILRGERYLDE